MMLFMALLLALNLGVTIWAYPSKWAFLSGFGVLYCVTYFLWVI